MSAGRPLTDADREPWLAAIRRWIDTHDNGVISCSALKRRYRDHIRKEAGAPVLFVHLAGSRKLIATRMAARAGHFMPASLIDSQFAALEPPGPDENAVTVDIDRPLERIVDDIATHLEESVP
jgi:gluconokinase